MIVLTAPLDSPSSVVMAPVPPVGSETELPVVGLTVVVVPAAVLSLTGPLSETVSWLAGSAEEQAVSAVKLMAVSNGWRMRKVLCADDSRSRAAAAA
nr:hypothetical protein [Nannocystis sp.]